VKLAESYSSEKSGKSDREDIKKIRYQTNKKKEKADIHNENGDESHHTKRQTDRENEIWRREGKARVRESARGNK
jgi:hypothetical protein